MEISTLFLEWKSGNTLAYDQIFKKLYPVLCHYASNFGLETEEAEEVVQDCFCQMWTQQASFQKVIDLKSYLYTSIRHASFNRLKAMQTKRHREQIYFEKMDVHELAVDHFLMESEILMELREAILKLPSQCGKIVWLSYVDGLSGKEIAQQMGLTVSTIHNQKSRGIKLLRKTLNQTPSLWAYFLFLQQF